MESEIINLSEKYVQIKNDVIKKLETLTASQLRLKRALHEEIEKNFKSLGHKTIPSIEFCDFNSLSEKKKKGRDSKEMHFQLRMSFKRKKRFLAL